MLDHLDEGDAVALDHRPTPALVGLGVDLTEMALEMVGSEDGLCRGRGGHMHLFAPELLAASSGIVGAAAPVACGCAGSSPPASPQRRRRELRRERHQPGMTMEAFNLAVVWDLPVVFVVKDNGWAITTRSAAMTGGSIGKRAKGFGMPVAQVDGGDSWALWRAAGKAIDRARRSGGPSVLRRRRTP